MKWNDFVKEKERYLRLWSELKKEYDGKMKKFLDKSYMVVAYYPGQVELDESPLSIAQNNKKFLVEDKRGEEFIKLAGEYKKADWKGDAGQKDKLAKRIAVFDISQLSVIEHRFELRFPTVAIDLIQELKASKYCNKELTDMSKASIRVVLCKADH